mmetsp:Transcript_10536/g.39754  ORF Transcript_10536/g.39754 Transcript_10536/m.39754 type:complete len:134 (-) Transcript_10536:256-657(-)
MASSEEDNVLRSVLESISPECREEVAAAKQGTQLSMDCLQEMRQTMWSIQENQAAEEAAMEAQGNGTLGSLSWLENSSLVYGSVAVLLVAAAAAVYYALYRRRLAPAKSTGSRQKKPSKKKSDKKKSQSKKRR